MHCADQSANLSSVNLTFIEVDLDYQTMVLFDHHRTIQFKISSSKYGIGNLAGSKQTPLGMHVVCEKIGDLAPIYTIFKSRINTGKICDQLNEPSISDLDLILTRILRLKGEEYGLNLGYDIHGNNVDSFSRFIYIHGTNREDLLSTPSSCGCIRMANDEIIELFDLVNIGTKVHIKSNRLNIA